MNPVGFPIVNFLYKTEEEKTEDIRLAEEAAVCRVSFSVICFCLFRVIGLFFYL